MEAQEPRPSGLVRTPVRASPLGETVGGSVCFGNVVDAFREGKAPKGESQERCQRETELARVRREEAVERVTKP